MFKARIGWNGSEVKNYQDVIDAVADKGEISVHYEVQGFWSRETVSFYVRKNYKGEISTDITWSSGGRDEYDNVQGSVNHANAVLHAAEICTQLKNSEKELRAAFNVYDLKYRTEMAQLEAQRQKEREEEQKKKEELREKELPLALGDKAEEMLEYLAKHSYYPSYFRKAGSPEYNNYRYYDKIEARITDTGRDSFYLNDKFVSRAKMIKHLEDMIPMWQQFSYQYFTVEKAA